jgi:tetratricopeptide (TPR) repeat protein/DNA-binding winged helix-turn-helix (wHTH) protein
VSDPVYQLDEAFEVHPDLGCLRRTDGDELPLRPKTFQTLLYLIRNRHRLVTKDELATYLWADTAVTDDALVQCIVELRKALGDAAKEPRFVRTIPKLGYRFVGNVRAIGSVPSSEPVLAPMAAPVTGRQWSVLPVSVALTAVVIAGVAWAINGGTRTETAALDPTSGKPGIAVMFLDNQSQSAERDWMRQGLAEMLITGLSRSNRVNVLGRKHLLTLLEAVSHPADREIPLDVAREVARRASASHLLTGSFAQVGGVTRIDVRIETLDARPVASESVTIDLPDDVLPQVDQLAWRLARNFDAAIERPTAPMAAGMTANLSAYQAYSLGMSKAMGLQNAEAVKLFERALELDPNFIMARARLGYVYGVTWAQPQLAVPHLDEVFRHASDLRESDRLQIEAWRAMARLDYAAAITPYQRLIRLYPYEIEAYNRLSRLLAGERRYQEAIDVARRGLTLDPDSRELHNQLGGAYLDIGRRADALLAHRRYVELAPDEPNSHDSLGLTLQTMGRYDEAEASFDHALALKPDFEPALAHLANVHFQTGRYRSAERLYERLAASDSEPVQARGHQSIALIRARAGRWEEARSSARTADDLYVKIHGDSYLRWCSIRIDLEQRTPAVAQRIDTTRIFADRGSRLSARLVQSLVGRIALRNGQVDRALDHFRLALNERPIVWDTDPVEDVLALAHLDLGRWDDAIAEFQRLLQANPRYPRAHYHLALAYERKGDRAAARQALTKFLMIWSGADEDIPEIIDAKARLARLTS